MPTPVKLIDSATGKAIESFKTAFGRMLGISTYQKEKSLWQSVSWDAAVEETALVSPIGDGSIEICDIQITAEKKSGGSITIHFDDSPDPGGNTKDVVKSTVADGVLNIASNFIGKVQGWQGAVLYYTVVGTFIGSILITFVKHDKAHSKTYAKMAKDCGW